MMKVLLTILFVGFFVHADLVLALDALPGVPVPDGGPVEERREALSKERQDRVINLASNVSLRLTKVVERFQNITARLERRITKLQALGIDTSRATAELESAKALIRGAESSLKEMESVRSAVSGDTPRASFQIIKGKLLAIRDNLKEAQSLLKNTIVLLRTPTAVPTQTEEIQGSTTTGTST